MIKYNGFITTNHFPYHIKGNPNSNQTINNITCYIWIPKTESNIQQYIETIKKCSL